MGRDLGGRPLLRPHCGNLEQAQNYAIFVGWQIDSRLPLDRPGGGHETLKEKVLRICDARPDFHFYFLMWDHAYFYVFERETWQGRVWKKHIRECISSSIIVTLLAALTTKSSASWMAILPSAAESTSATTDGTLLSTFTRTRGDP